MFRYAVLVLLMFLYMGLLANDHTDRQTNTLDSLMQLAEDENMHDTIRMDVLYQISRQIRNDDPAHSLSFAEDALDIALLNQYHNIAARIMGTMGNIYWRLGDFKRAFVFLHEANQIYVQQDNVHGVASTLNHLGALHYGRGYYDTALEYFLSAASIAEELDTLEFLAYLLNNIGWTYQKTGDMHQAMEYHKRALEILNQDEFELAKSFVFNGLGTLNQEQGNHELALFYFRSSLDIRRRYPDQRDVANAKRKLGYLYYLMGAYDQAMDKLQRTHDLYLSLGDNQGISRTVHNLGKIHMAQGQYTKAGDCFHRSLRLAKEIEIDQKISKNYLSLSVLSEVQNDYTLAYAYLQQHMDYREKIVDDEGRQRVIEMQLMFDRQRKEDEIDILNKSNRINELNLQRQHILTINLLMLLLLSIALLLVVFYRYRETKKTNRILSRQKEEIASKNQLLQELNARLVEQKKKVDELNRKLKASEKHLMSVNATKDKFFSIISHDLRNPFASIVSFSRILKRDISNLGKNELLELTAELDKSVEKINSLLENLLQWSRTQRGVIDFQPGYFGLKDAVTETIQLFSRVANEKEISISDHTDDRIMVWGDLNMTRTIIRNLLSNAVKYSHKGGRVELHSRKKDDMVEISVVDHGVGIPEDVQAKLFHSSSLFSTYGTDDEKGSGLGLLLCNEFVRRQGGDIFMKSKEGQGSVFTFTLPLKPSK